MIDSLQFDREREANVSRSTISTFQLFELIPDEKSAIQYLEGRLWKGEPRLDRLASFVDLVAGVRITYQQLKGGKTWFDANSLAQEMPR
jgi:hypothetical protein